MRILTCHIYCAFLETKMHLSVIQYCCCQMNSTDDSFWRSSNPRGFPFSTESSLIRKCLGLVWLPVRPSINVMVMNPGLLSRAASPSSFHAAELGSSLHHCPVRCPDFGTEPLITPWLLPAGVEWAPLRVTIPGLDVQGQPRLRWGCLKHIKDTLSTEMDHSAGLRMLTRTRVRCKGEVSEDPF